MEVGFATNNEAELMAVKQVLSIVVRENYHSIIVESDSTLVTGILRKIQQGTPWEKITKSWCKARLIQEINRVIHDIGYIIPLHIRRGGNRASDYLATGLVRMKAKN